jgi:hypothetical protein
MLPTVSLFYGVNLSFVTTLEIFSSEDKKWMNETRENVRSLKGAEIEDLWMWHVMRTTEEQVMTFKGTSVSNWAAGGWDLLLYKNWYFGPQK